MDEKKWVLVRSRNNGNAQYTNIQLANTLA